MSHSNPQTNNTDKGNTDSTNNTHSNHQKIISSSQQSPPPELERAISQFQQVLWTPSIEKANSILNAHPLVLSHQNTIGFLPLHIAIKCTRSAYRSQIIKLIIEKGVEFNVGANGDLKTIRMTNTTMRNNYMNHSCTSSNTRSRKKQKINTRGGLLVQSMDKQRTGLCLLVVGDDKTDILHYLVHRKPTPLLTPYDVIQFNLLHRAASDPFHYVDRYPTLNFLIRLSPRALMCRNENGDVPILFLCKQPGYSYDILHLLFLKGFQMEELMEGREEEEEEEDGLQLDQYEDYSLKAGFMLEHAYNNSDALFSTCLQKDILPLLTSIGRTDVPILQSLIGIVTIPDILNSILTTLPHLGAWCHVKDSKGRLPLHVAAQVGWKWDGRMDKVVGENIHATGEVDPITGLFPFLLAAAGSLSFIESDADSKDREKGQKEKKQRVDIREGEEEIGNGIDGVTNDVNMEYEHENDDQSFRACDLNSIYRLARCNPNCIGFQNMNIA